jgi:hypothetical protein
MTITIQRAEKCAWRALYVRVNGRQVAHIGIDAHRGFAAHGPELFGGIGRGYTDYRQHRIRLPWFSFRLAYRLRRFGGLAIYRAFERLRWALVNPDFKRRSYR